MVISPTTLQTNITWPKNDTRAQIKWMGRKISVGFHNLCEWVKKIAREIVDFFRKKPIVQHVNEQKEIIKEIEPILKDISDVEQGVKQGVISVPLAREKSKEDEDDSGSDVSQTEETHLPKDLEELKGPEVVEGVKELPVENALEGHGEANKPEEGRVLVEVVLQAPIEDVKKKTETEIQQPPFALPVASISLEHVPLEEVSSLIIVPGGSQPSTPTRNAAPFSTPEPSPKKESKEIAKKAAVDNSEGRKNAKGLMAWFNRA